MSSFLFLFHFATSSIVMSSTTCSGSTAIGIVFLLALKLDPLSHRKGSCSSIVSGSSIVSHRHVSTVILSLPCDHWMMMTSSVCVALSMVRLCFENLHCGFSFWSWFSFRCDHSSCFLSMCPGFPPKRQPALTITPLVPKINHTNDTLDCW